MMLMIFVQFKVDLLFLKQLTVIFTSSLDNCVLLTIFIHALDSCEMPSKDDKGHTDKNKKKIIKTRAQRDGLEKFYQEHKYPTESMKVEVARSLRLTEKQVSGWFCHRRLKDKRLLIQEKYANARQDRSSGVIQDRGSGFKQDSCGSTKQGDDKNFDHREVESRRFTGPEVSAADVTYGAGTQYRAESNLMEDTPSGSSSSLQDARFSQNPESFDMSRYRSCNIPADLKSVKPRNGPSGYLKVKGQVENAAITAVKRQLGSLYRQDGPPLGIEFDPPPPGAFESSVQNPVNEVEYAGEPVPAISPDFSKVYKQSNSCIGYGSLSKEDSHVSDLDGASFKKSLKSAHPEYSFNHKPGQKSSTHDGDHYDLGLNVSVDIRKASAREMAVDSRCNYKFMDKYDGAEFKTSTGYSSGFRSSCAAKVIGEQAKPRPTSRKEVNLEIVKEDDLKCKPSRFVHKGSKYRDYRYCQERELPSKVDKGYIHVDSTTVDENYNPVHVKIPWETEMRGARRARAESPNHQEQESVTRMTSRQIIG